MANDSMTVYNSSLSGSFGARFVRHIMFYKLLLFLLIFPKVRSLFENWTRGDWVIFFLVYFILTIVYLGLFNHDFFIKEGKIGIRSSLFTFFKMHEIKFSNIKKITLKHEEPVDDRFFSFQILKFFLFPFDYKWVKISTRFNKTYTYYCFGLDYDCYDNTDEKDLMENLFRDLLGKGVRVGWTKANDTYFDEMSEKAEKRFL